MLYHNKPLIDQCILLWYNNFQYYIFYFDMFFQAFFPLNKETTWRASQNHTPVLGNFCFPIIIFLLISLASFSYIETTSGLPLKESC